MSGIDPGDPRIHLAGERTFLAWVRTGLAMMGFGFVVARLGLFLRELAYVKAAPHSGTSVSLWIGTVLVLLGALMTAGAGLRHVRFVGRFARGEPYRGLGAGPLLILALVVAAIGIGLTVHLITMP